MDRQGMGELIKILFLNPPSTKLRNLLYLSETNMVRYLLPKENVKLVKQLETFLDQVQLKKNLNKNVRVIFIEDILSLTYDSVDLLKYLDRFREKYIIVKH